MGISMRIAKGGGIFNREWTRMDANKTATESDSAGRF
jgi:hypothetical protein